MADEWTVTFLEGEIPWSDAWTPESRGVEVDASLVEELIELDSGDHDLFKTLVGMFRHDTDVHLPVLRTAASSHDTPTLSNLGHSLAGEAAQIGATSLATHCRAIESAALRGEFDLCSRLVDVFPEHLEQYVSAVEVELKKRA